MNFLKTKSLSRRSVIRSLSGASMLLPGMLHEMLAAPPEGAAADPIDGDIVAAIGDLAKHHGASAIEGVRSRRRQNRFREGDRAGRCRKRRASKVRQDAETDRAIPQIERGTGHEIHRIRRIEKLVRKRLHDKCDSWLGFLFRLCGFLTSSKAKAGQKNHRWNKNRQEALEEGFGFHSATSWACLNVTVGDGLG